MRGFVLLLVLFLCLASSYESSGQVKIGRPDSSANTISSDERQALVALYQATDGSGWKDHQGWLGPAGTECEWYGVVCESYGSKPPKVIDLNLADDNLSGRVPQEIEKLVHLQSLFLFGNNLSGRLPASFIERWLAGTLWINADAAQFTDVTQIDYENSASALLCARHRLLLHSDTTAMLYTVRCRNASADDRGTYCEVKKGKIWGEEFARLAWIIEKNGYFSLKREYQRNITDSGFSSIRLIKNGKKHDVVDYAGGGPLELWTIEAVIEGAASSLSWDTTEEQSECPPWDKDSTQP